MARLSVSDLNNLSGVSEKDLNTLYEQFRTAHTKVYNDLNKWVNVYDTLTPILTKYEDTSLQNDLIVYKNARDIYYEGSMTLDELDLFEYYTNEYLSILTKCSNVSKLYSNIRVLVAVLMKLKEPIVQKLSNCYGMFSEAYDRICKKEEDDER